MTIFVRTGLIS